MFLVCQVISQNHVILWPYGFMGKRESRSVTILPSFVVINIVLVEIYNGLSLSRDIARPCDQRVE